MICPGLVEHLKLVEAGHEAQPGVGGHDGVEVSPGQGLTR